MNNKELKKCCKCNENLARESHGYCAECYSEYKRRWNIDNKEHNKKYHKTWREEQKSNYIYMFIPAVEEYSQEVLNIGSTVNMNIRMSEHRRLKSKASKVIKESGREFNIIYAEIEEDLTRDELYFIEYYLIHKYFAMQGVNPIGNDRDTYTTNICTSRQFQLILIAERLQYKKYDIFKEEYKKICFSK